MTAADPLAPLLAGGRALVIDGGLSNELEALGADLSDALWSARLLIEDPGTIVAAHLAYYRAGARVATTASYQATFEGFAARGIGRTEAADLMRLSVRLADEARTARRAEAPDAGPLLVAASVGPYGAMLADGSEYRGRYGLSVARLRDFHRDRLAVLAGAGADLLALETIPELEEVEALVALLDEVAGDPGGPGGPGGPGATPAWLSLTLSDGGRLRSGAPLEEAVDAAVASRRVVAVGVNCTAAEHVEEAVGRIRARTDRAVIVYPNSGDGWDAAAKRWIPREGPTVDGATVRRWVAAGASIVGGCCRVGPERIAEVAAAVG